MGVSSEEDDMQVNMEQLLFLLQERQTYLYARNLALIALPIEAAHLLAPQIAQALKADYLDFDRELLQELEQDDWDEHVALDRKGTLAIGRSLAERWLRRVGDRLNKERPLVIGNANLAVRYQVDVARSIYDATQNGLCILAFAGRMQGQALLLHGALPQTGAGSQAYELIMPTIPPEPPDIPQAVQERLF